jgi:zinc transport system substrate-binding protein
MRCLFNYISIVFGILYVFLGNAFADDKLLVFVTIAPQQYFVQQIGKDLVDVQIMVEPGADPHTYEPKPKQMVAISKAQLYFAVGIEFEEANLSKITATNPNLKVIHTDHGIDKRAMEVHHHQDDQEADHHEGDHAKTDHGHDDHAGLDPHIWLSPPLVKIQAHTILTALQKADPAHQGVYEKNFNAFTSEIDQLDADLKKIFAGRTGLQFMVFHPSWGYFAHAYGLKQVPIEIEGKRPKPAQLKALIQHARDKRIKVVFVQPQFSTQSAEVVAREISGQVAFADPLAEDWMANLREVADKFQAALK